MASATGKNSDGESLHAADRAPNPEERAAIEAKLQAEGFTQ